MKQETLAVSLSHLLGKHFRYHTSTHCKAGGSNDLDGPFQCTATRAHMIILTNSSTAHKFYLMKIDLVHRKVQPVRMGACPMCGPIR